MSKVQTPRWIAAQATVLTMVLIAGVVAALTLHAPAPVGPDTLRLVGSAGQAAAAAGSFRMDMDFSVEGAGFEIDVEGTAEVDEASGDGQGQVDIPGGGTIRFLATGGRAYYELPEGSPMRLGSKSWVGFPVPEGADAAAAAGLTENPLDFLRLMSGDGEVLDMGSDEVRGVPARRYRSSLDLAGLATMADEQQGGTLMSSQLAQLDADGHADVWLSEDGLPRRMRVEFEAQGVTAVFSFDLFDYGVAVDVAPPPAAEVLEVESQAEAGRFLTGS